MGLTNTSASSSGNNQDIVDKLDEILFAFNGLQFNQSPLLTTTSPPIKIILLPGETKQIIPASTSPRRIIIKSLSGEIKLLLGTSQNIELSAIAVDNNCLVDERWSGQIFAYSEKGGVIAVNVEKAATINAPPIAKNDQTTAMHNQAVVLNILSNDSDSDGSITGIDLDIYTPDMQNTASTSQGIFSVDDSGELVFTPADGFAGMASLNYQVFDDGGSTDTANIYITVDEPPSLVATNDDFNNRMIISGTGIWHGTNRNASANLNEDITADGALRQTVWFEWRPLVNDWYRINIRPKSSEGEDPDPDFYLNMQADSWQGWLVTDGRKSIYGRRDPSTAYWLLIDSKIAPGDFELEIVLEPL